MAAVVSHERRFGGYFNTYSSRETGCDELLAALVSRRDDQINGSVLALLKDGKARVSYSEKGRSAPDSFWRGIVDPLERFLESVPKLVSLEDANSVMFQVQWLTGRKANYWHQDVRWKTHWDKVLFLYAGETPTPTDIACPKSPPTIFTTPDEYVRHVHGHPEIHEKTASGEMIIYRPKISQGDSIVIDNRVTWHRTSPLMKFARPDDALLTVRLKRMSSQFTEDHQGSRAL